jgi:hypothetical protein
MRHLFFARLPNIIIWSGLIGFLILFTGACDPKVKQTVPVVLSPLNEADKNELINEINRFAVVKSIRGKVNVGFVDNSFAESGIADKYKNANGFVVVESPAKINLKIQIPVLGSDLVQMTSDGEKFRVAVICCVDEKYRKFVYGTNTNDYVNLREKIRGRSGGRGSEQEKSISVFSSLRPQHFTAALLMSPTKNNEYAYSQSEIYEDEAGTTRARSPISRVIRGYYLLDELKKISDDDFRISRRFWFDRVGSIRLARQQIFDEKGILETDIAYGAEEKSTDGGGNPFFASVTITRPQERYSVTLTYQTPAEVVIGKTAEPSYFILENQWQLPEVDLDKQSAQSKSNKQTTE